MGRAREQNKRTAKVPRGRKSSLSSCFEPTGQSVRASVGKDAHASPYHTGNGSQNSPAAFPNAKIKLQLYPIDENTRLGLVKNGIHPYLELTLRPTKRISSVLRHINNKWGSSNVALGEPMLSPYNMDGDISRCRKWTMKDNGIQAGDVYTSIGRPATFRLRYGWVLTSELKTSEEAIPYSGCLQSEKDLIADKDEDGVQRADSVSEQTATPWIKEVTDVSMGALLFEASLEAKLNVDEPRSAENNTDLRPAQTSIAPLWADSLNDISIGGLFSEASLQGKFDNGNTSKSISGSADSTQLFSDSLDAFLYARTRCPQGPRPPSHDLQTFILDGEETCHAFPVPKFSSSGKRVSAIGGDSGSRSFKFPKIEESKTESGVSEDRNCPDSQADLSLHDENSLGLGTINWANSLGPFDFGLSASRKLIKEEDYRPL